MEAVAAEFADLGWPRKMSTHVLENAVVAEGMKPERQTFWVTV